MLTAIGLHRRGCGLSGLLGAADTCNHAILDEQEVAQGWAASWPPGS